jgi:ATP-binding cassette subfamily C protein
MHRETDKRSGKIATMTTSNPVDKALSRLRPAIIAAFLLAFVSTLLYFVIPLYMLQIFERVTASRNLNTLMFLTLIVVFLVIVDAAISQLKSIMLQRAATDLDRQLSGPLFEQVHKSIVGSDRSDNQARLSDLEYVRNFISGSSLTAITQAVFAPIFLVIMWILHPAFAGILLVAMVLVAVLTVLSRKAAEEANGYANTARTNAEELSKNLFYSFETVQALGMRRFLRDIWLRKHNDGMAWAMLSTRKSAMYGGMLNLLQTGIQVATYGIGAYLVIHDNLNMGVLMAASMIAGRAFSPVHSVISNWRSISTARTSLVRLRALFEETAAKPDVLQLPTPAGRLTLEGVGIAPPGMPLSAAVLRGVTFDLPAGSVLAVIGPSAAGKTTLLKSLVGIWRPVIGEIRLDGSALTQWDDEVLGQHFGYLAPEVDLFPGTIAQNIKRFSNASDDEVVAAAKRSHVHEMILQLPKGYSTEVNSRGTGLSSGQRQRVGLARAIFGNPRLIVLDEPNANLDAAGEEKLMETIRMLRAEGRTVVFVSHKVSLVQAADYVLVLGAGGVKDFGPRDKVMQKMIEPRLVGGAPLRAV